MISQSRHRPVDNRGHNGTGTSSMSFGSSFVPMLVVVYDIWTHFQDNPKRRSFERIPLRVASVIVVATWNARDNALLPDRNQQLSCYSHPISVVHSWFPCLETRDGGVNFTINTSATIRTISNMGGVEAHTVENYRFWKLFAHLCRNVIISSTL